MIAALWPRADRGGPLAVLLHGRGADETSIAPVASLLDPAIDCVAPRGGVTLPTGGYGWFENRGIGRPRADSLRHELDMVWSWLEEVAPARPVVAIGFSGGAAFAGGLALDRPERLAGVALLYGTLPFDAGLASEPSRLTGLPVFFARADDDGVIPRDLLDHSEALIARVPGSVLRRHPGGHAIDPSIHEPLRTWVTASLVGS